MIENQDKRIQELTDYYDRKSDDWVREIIARERLARKKGGYYKEQLYVEKDDRPLFDFCELDKDSKWLALILLPKKYLNIKFKEYFPPINSKMLDRIMSFLKMSKEMRNKALDVKENITIKVNDEFLLFEYKKHSLDKLNFAQMNEEQKWMILMLLSNIKNFPFHKFQTTSKFRVEKSILRKSFKDVAKLVYFNYQNKEKLGVRIKSIKTRSSFEKVKKYDYNYLVSKYGERNAEKIRSLPIFPQYGISELEDYKLLNNHQKASYCSFRVSHVYKSKRKIASDFFAYANSKGYDIQYALNPRERSVYYPNKMKMPKRSHYSLDGIDFLRKIVFEWADPYHYRNNGWSKIEDFIRERRIRYFYPSYCYIEINEKKYFPYGKVFGRERYKIFDKIIEDIKAIIE